MLDSNTLYTGDFSSQRDNGYMIVDRYSITCKGRLLQLLGKVMSDNDEKRSYICRYFRVCESLFFTVKA